MRVKAKNHDSIDITGLSAGRAALIFNILKDELERTTNEVRKGLLPELLQELESGLNQAHAIQTGVSLDDVERRRKKNDEPKEPTSEVEAVVTESPEPQSEELVDDKMARKIARAERKAARLAKREARRLAREEKRRSRKSKKG